MTQVRFEPGLFHSADLLLIGRSHDPEPAIEAFAARAIAPTDPYVWRRWAMVQMDLQRPLEALASFREYFRLGGAAAQSDTEARQLAESIRASIPRGVIDPEQMPEGLPQ